MDSVLGVGLDFNWFEYLFEQHPHQFQIPGVTFSMGHTGVS